MSLNFRENRKNHLWLSTDSGLENGGELDLQEPGRVRESFLFPSRLKGAVLSLLPPVT